MSGEICQTCIWFPECPIRKMKPRPVKECEYYRRKKGLTSPPKPSTLVCMYRRTPTPPTPIT